MLNARIFRPLQIPRKIQQIAYGALIKVEQFQETAPLKIISHHMSLLKFGFSN